MDELSNLRMFVRVVEEGSFSAAARSLGIVPSSVSRQVSQLEGELGARLFHRTTRKQSLTETGEIYFQHAYRIVADLDEAQLAVNRLTDTPSGTLHVTIEADFAVAFIAPILPDFLDRYPDVNVRISMTPDNMDLIEGGLDLAIRIGHLEDSSLIARKLAVSHSLLCASPNYLATHGTPSHPSELTTHSCLSFRVKPGKNHWRFRMPAETVDVPISGCLNANSLSFLRSMAVTGRGIIMVPKWMVRDDLKHGHLVPVLEDFSLDPTGTPINAIPIPIVPAQLLARRGGNKEVRHGMRQGRPLAGFSEDGNGV